MRLVVECVVGHHRIWSDAKHPVVRAVQVEMPANNRRRSNLVVVKAHGLGWITKQILLEVSVNAAEHRVRNHRSVLVVWSKPLRSAHTKVLLHHRPMEVCV